MVEVFLTNGGQWRFRVMDSKRVELAISPSYDTEALARTALGRLPEHVETEAPPINTSTFGAASE